MKARLLLSTLLMVLPICLEASSVSQVSFDQLARSSEFIFEGRVTGKRGEQDSRGMIRTRVTFEVVDVIKGSAPSGTITLTYLGGTVGTLTMSVADSAPPEIGERGIYFVESINRPAVHPLYGWDQGHFIVSTSDPRTARVYTRSGKPVLALDRVQGMIGGVSSGVAAGVVVAEISRQSEAISVSEFKRKVIEAVVQR